MKKYRAELLILSIQCFMFYIFPYFAGPTDAMGMVVLILITTLCLSALLGSISDKWIKFSYPVAIALLFIPSVFIHYNESAIIHALWYLTVSAVGLLTGSLIHSCLYRSEKTCP